MQEDQPTFFCVTTGERYWVGFSQSIELEWVQNRMGIPVEPIAPADVIDSVFTENVREQALQLSTLLNVDPQTNIETLGMQKDDFSYVFAYQSPATRELATVGRKVEELLLDVEVAWVAAIIEQQRRLLSDTKLRRAYIRTAVKQSIAKEVGISKEDGSEEAVLGEIATAINEQLAKAQKRDWAWKLSWTQHSKQKAKVRFKKQLCRTRRDKVHHDTAIVAKEEEKQRWKTSRQEAKKLCHERKKLAGKSWDDPGKWKPVPMLTQHDGVQPKKGEHAHTRTPTPNPLSPSHSAV
jgi:hypothetical protein